MKFNFLTIVTAGVLLLAGCQSKSQTENATASKDAVTEKPDIITLDYSLPDATATDVIEY